MTYSQFHSIGNTKKNCNFYLQVVFNMTPSIYLYIYFYIYVCPGQLTRISTNLTGQPVLALRLCLIFTTRATHHG